MVEPDERSAASGVATIAHSIGGAISPDLTGTLLADPVFWGVPFFLAGGFKIAYDLLLYRSFKGADVR